MLDVHNARHTPCTQRLYQTARNQGKTITWFNSSYNIEIRTNIVKKFFYLINKHFSLNNRLHKIRNKFDVKLSYSCMPKKACIIESHNNMLIYPTTHTNEMLYNCRTKSECPLNGKCRTKSIVYEASFATPNIPTRHFFGRCETELKTRFNNHL